jgi:demethylmenaquinone methyltransferase/2-methoxy-6-polyprenyl-1,4-benzoquinol methylase
MRGDPTRPSTATEALGGDAQKQPYVDWIFDHVADRYDLGNDIMSLGWHTRWKRRLVDYACVEPTHRVLDLACGTGDVTWMVAARARRGEVVGADINEAMMALAEPKRPAGFDHVRFVKADVTALPFDDASFDRVTIGYAGRGFPNWPTTLREIFRVLKPGGEVWNLDFARPPQAWWDRTYRGYMRVSGAALGLALHGNPRIYTYIPHSMKAYPGQRWLRDEMERAGLRADLIETTGCIMAYNRGVRPR